MGDEVKCVVGGDSAVGKTTLIQYLTGKEADDKIYNITMPVAHLDFDNVTLGVYDVGLFFFSLFYSSLPSFDSNYPFTLLLANSPLILFLLLLAHPTLLQAFNTKTSQSTLLTVLLSSFCAILSLVPNLSIMFWRNGTQFFNLFPSSQVNFFFPSSFSLP